MFFFLLLLLFELIKWIYPYVDACLYIYSVQKRNENTSEWNKIWWNGWKFILWACWPIDLVGIKAQTLPPTHTRTQYDGMCILNLKKTDSFKSFIDKWTNGWVSYRSVIHFKMHDPLNCFSMFRFFFVLRWEKCHIHLFA